MNAPYGYCPYCGRPGKRRGSLLGKNTECEVGHVYLSSQAVHPKSSKEAAEIERMTDALEQIALLDEADGHELTEKHAFEAVAIATSALGRHPSEIYYARLEARK